MNDLLPTNESINSINPWQTREAIEQIRLCYGRSLTELEFDLFVSIGRATGLNPFLRELWAVKYDRGSAQIFIGRDGYRKSAQRHPLYDYHTSDAVYSNDEYSVVNGIPHHKYGDIKNRGVLMGAYALAQRKGSSRPTYVFAELKEYTSGQALWKTKPATMIKKVAEAQALRGCFQELFAGTYDESEDWKAQQVHVAMQNVQRGINGLKEKLGLPVTNNPVDVIDELEIESDDENIFTYEDIVNMITGAATMAELQEAGKLARTLAKEAQDNLRPLYKERQEEIKAQHTNREINECPSHSILNQ